MKWIVALFACSIIYSAIRYVAFAPKNLENLPVFVVNKGVSMAAALCFLAAFVQQFRRQRGATIGVQPSSWFRAGVFGAIWHIPMSLAVLRPAYFKEFFIPATEAAAASGRMSFAGEMVFCFGGLAAGGLYLLTRQQWTPLQRWWLSVGAMVMLQVHVLAMGYCRGLNINASHAYMPPMWLLSAVGVFACLVVLLVSRPKPVQDSAQAER
ncbi:MAG: hypothetical protein KIT19_00430 [Phycisphaeraceae bacterium]|nr:hypothetical protein [Phycisphaeraceae bacterium]